MTSERASIVLDQVADDVTSIHLSNRRASYIADEACAAEEGEPTLYPEVDPKDFSFDQEILTTAAYRRVHISPGLRHEKSRVCEGLGSANSEKATGPIAIDQIVAIESTTSSEDGPRSLVELFNAQPSMPNGKIHPHQPFSIPRKPLPNSALPEKNELVEVPDQSANPSEDINPQDIPRGSGPATTLQVIADSPPASRMKPLDLPPDRQDSRKSPGDSAGSHADEASAHALISITAVGLVQTTNFTPVPPKVTLGDFMPQASHVVESTKLKPHPLKLWVSPTVITIIGRDISYIPANAVIAVQNTLKSLVLLIIVLYLRFSASSFKPSRKCFSSIDHTDY